MEKVAWVTLLFDFYGELLTDRQKKFIDLYYGNDFSLGEIAENYNVSRQAVYDSIKRAEAVLRDYEDKLGLVSRFLEQREKLSGIADLLRQSEDPGQAQLVSKARKMLEELLEITGE